MNAKKNFKDLSTVKFCGTPCIIQIIEISKMATYLKTKASQNLEHKTTCILEFKNLIIRRKKRFQSPPPHLGKIFKIY